jgi:ABC-type uncharacterized transport system involved in gliding motility auxiliary subunit
MLNRLFRNSFVVIALAVVSLVAVNVFAYFYYSRVDLTQAKSYTLSEGTRELLKKLQAPITIRFYFSQSEAGMPLVLKGYGRRVQDLLIEYRNASGGKISIEILDPQPDSDQEETATLDGVQAQSLDNGDRFYLGLAVKQDDRKSAMSNIAMDRERLLEYDITRAIASVTEKEKTVLGVMSPMPVFGNSGFPMMGVPPSPKQVFISELERDYKVVQVPMDGKDIDPQVKVLLVHHPRGITEHAEYSIDQFVMRGGKLIALLDPFAFFDVAPGQRGMEPTGIPSNLERLTKAWGISLDTTKMLSDMQYMVGKGPSALPTLLSLNDSAYDQTDVATARLGGTLFPFIGAFSGQPVAGLNQEVLMHSSKYSALIEAARGQDRGDKATAGFKAAGQEMPIAIRLQGKFNTAFPDGRPPKPKPEKKPEDEAAKDKPAGDEKPVTEAAAAPADTSQKPAEEPPEVFAAHIAQGTADNSLVLIADTDFINDGAAVQIQDMLGQRLVYPINGNLAFVQALVDQYAGDAALISLRTRQSATRPFTVIKEMEARAQQAYTEKIKDIQDSLQATQEKLQALQKTAPVPGAAAGAAILTKEQQAEVDRFRKVAAEKRRELKEVRKDLRADSEALQFWIKVLNIALIPALLVVLAFGLMIYRRRGKVA